MPEEQQHIWVWTPQHGVKHWAPAFPVTDLGEKFLTTTMAAIAKQSGDPENWIPMHIYFFATEREVLG